MSYSKLYGRRILHVLSPVRFDKGRFEHTKDSNYKCTERIISWLPDCHHYVLVPTRHNIPDNRQNVTLLKYPYPTNAVSNRSQFDTKAFLQVMDMRHMDIDFLFVNQPELMYNILVALMDKRYGEILKRVAFFHWVDCAASRGSPAIPHGYMRQLEAINLSDKVYFHSEVSMAALKSNFNRVKAVELNESYISDKTSYMPTSHAPFEGEQEIQLPNKKIIVFNHRWSQSTGMNRFLEYTEPLLKDSQYLLWVTDKDAEVPKGYHTSDLNYKEYAYLLKNSYCSVCFVDSYATWNLSVQDGVSLRKPVLVYEHPVMKAVLGKDYPLFFKTPQEFMFQLENLREHVDYPLMPHDETFKENLIRDMESMIDVPKNTPKDALAWLYYIANDYSLKSQITSQVQDTIQLNSVWQYIRRWLLANGVVDDPNHPLTKYTISDEKVKELIEGMNMSFKPINKKVPPAKLVKKHDFF